MAIKELDTTFDPAKFSLDYTFKQNCELSTNKTNKSNVM
jgi:hypothetical protein